MLFFMNYFYNCPIEAFSIYHNNDSSRFCIFIHNAPDLLYKTTLIAQKLTHNYL